jgi:hypothetical protein
MMWNVKANYVNTCIEHVGHVDGQDSLKKFQELKAVEIPQVLILVLNDFIFLGK